MRLGSSISENIRNLLILRLESSIFFSGEFFHFFELWLKVHQVALHITIMMTNCFSTLLSVSKRILSTTRP